MVESEAEGVRASDYSAFCEREGHLEGRETSAYSAVALAGLRNRNGAIVQRYPGTFVDLHAHHVGVAQTMNLHPQVSDLACQESWNLDSGTGNCAVLADHLDRKSHDTRRQRISH